MYHKIVGYIALLLVAGIPRSYSGSTRLLIIGGEVLEDRSGEPIAGAVIRYSLTGIGSAELETDGRGRFVTTDLPWRPSYQLLIEKQGYVSASLEVRPQAGATESAIRKITLRMIRAGAISGRIEQGEGGVVVAYEAVSRDQRPRLFSTHLSRSGDFRIHGLPLGRFHLVAINLVTRSGVAPRGIVVYPGSAEPREFDINGGNDYEGLLLDVPHVDLVKASGRVIVPRIGLAGPPVLSVVATSYPSIPVITQVLGGDGQFSTTNMLPDRYELLASASPAEPGQPVLFGRVQIDLTLGSVGDLDIVLKPWLEKRIGVTVASVGENVVGCSAPSVVSVTPLEAWRPELRFPPSPVRSGAATLWVPPGRSVAVGSDVAGRCAGVTEIAGESGDEGATVASIALAPPGRVSGRVDDVTPLLLVLIGLTEGRGSPTRILLVDHSRDFVFDDVLPGTYHLGAFPIEGARGPWINPKTLLPSFVLRAGQSLTTELRLGPT